MKYDTYYYFAETKTLSNLTTQEELEGEAYGYMVLGVFETQEQVDNSFAQPNASVGGVRLFDINADATITADDKINNVILGYSPEDSLETITVYLADKNP